MTSNENSNPPRPGYYRHYKGGNYQVLGMARHTETEEEMVVYRYLYGDHGLSVRPLRLFLDPVTVDGETRARFEPASPAQPAPSEADVAFMSRALELARIAGESGEVPVGAVVVLDGRIVGEGCNSPVGGCDPTAHAEINALRAAASAIGNYRLPGAKLYVSIEPCCMCAGALMHARIGELIFGATEPKAGVVTSQLHILEQHFFNHRLPWRGGVLADKARALMQSFFRDRRHARLDNGAGD